MCSAGSRLLLQEGIKDAVLEKVQALSRKRPPGDPLDPATQLGAIVDETQMKRSEEHTSELQSPCNLVCRLLLEKKKQNYSTTSRSAHTRMIVSAPASSS